MIAISITRWRRDDELISDVVGFWKQAGNEGRWFDKDNNFDRRFKERFLDLHMAVAARKHDDWVKTPEGALALLILTDQFPRNAFRGTGHMYATDPLARQYAREAQAAGHMERVEVDLRLFFCLPFAHSEEIADQDLSVALNAKLGEPWLSHAQSHRDIIRRFGRFPHRNPMLGRNTTTEEARFLKAGGFQG
ncbi:Uncharacterized conserved protein, DUF924 family [Xaviernesmea oryzae]|uniref:Uncharacterized conserved protein, DUF924 family n=1 Tax=Xaviernesmea oryzae TaxID=464029 RepID=A0A1X7FY36_9HYPH|nr:DUF924 family protein [Xaviernesmea oryzae]SMF60800.1 Uncharacterized conserved protein, DUF924 family [Xaviernesmea oryzae]